MHDASASLAVEPWLSEPVFCRLRVVLVRPRNPLNIGAAARAMCNFGVETLRLVQPWEPSFRDARSAVGAAEVLQNAQMFASLAEAVADCVLVVGTTAAHTRPLHQPLETLAQGTEQLRARLATAPVALLFGSEKTGLTNQEMSHCHWLMHIPTRSGQPSMNLGQAVAVCLYELTAGGARAAEAAPAAAALPAAAEHIERLTLLLLETLGGCGYLHAPEDSSEKKLSEEKLRRMLHRLSLSHEDAELWLGMLRQILWKLGHPER